MELSSFSKKVFLIFWEIKLSSTKLKKLVIFEEGTFQPQKKKKKKIHSEKISYVSRNGSF